MIKAVFWDFGGVITSSPFESFNRFEAANNLPSDFLRSVNSTNPDHNAWAKLERNEISLDEFDRLFFNRRCNINMVGNTIDANCWIFNTMAI